MKNCYKITSFLNSELNLSNLIDTIMNVAKKLMSTDACRVIHGKKNIFFQECDLELFLLLCNSAALAIHNAPLHLVLMQKDMEFVQSEQESFMPTSTVQNENFYFLLPAYIPLTLWGAITTTPSHLETMFWK